MKSLSSRILAAVAVAVLLGVLVSQQSRINRLAERLDALAATPPALAGSVARTTGLSAPPETAVVPSTSRPPRVAAGARSSDASGARATEGRTRTAEQALAMALAREQQAAAQAADAQAAAQAVTDALLTESFRSFGPRREVDVLGGEGNIAMQTGFIPVGLAANGKVSWDHAQATGAPDTEQSGDIPTAWAPRETQSGEQWLQLGYAEAVELGEITIHETHSAGAISRVAAVLPDGTERVFWTGNVAGEATGEILETTVPVPPGITAQQVRVYVDTNRVASWPEIDAVELVGTDGSRQWASESSASSSYSERFGPPAP